MNNRAEGLSGQYDHSAVVLRWVDLALKWHMSPGRRNLMRAQVCESKGPVSEMPENRSRSTVSSGYS